MPHYYSSTCTSRVLVKYLDYYENWRVLPVLDDHYKLMTCVCVGVVAKYSPLLNINECRVSVKNSSVMGISPYECKTTQWNEDPQTNKQIKSSKLNISLFSSVCVLRQYVPFSIHYTLFQNKIQLRYSIGMMLKTKF